MKIRAFSDALWRVGLRRIYPLARFWWRLTRPTIHGAYVILRVRGPALSEDEILLVRNSYKKAFSVPCGGIRRGEQPIEGALRELHEEVGISISPKRLKDRGKIFLVHDGRRDHGHFFECVLQEAERPPIRIDNREVVWAEFIPESDVLELELVPHLQRYLEAESGNPTGRRTTVPRANTQSGSAS